MTMNIGTVYTILVDGLPVATHADDCIGNVGGMIDTDWFQQDLRHLAPQPNGTAVYTGKEEITVRKANALETFGHTHGDYTPTTWLVAVTDEMDMSDGCYRWIGKPYEQGIVWGVNPNPHR